jgi:hypothetical protein
MGISIFMAYKSIGYTFLGADKYGFLGLFLSAYICENLRPIFLVRQALSSCFQFQDRSNH